MLLCFLNFPVDFQYILHIALNKIFGIILQRLLHSFLFLLLELVGYSIFKFPCFYACFYLLEFLQFKRFLLDCLDCLFSEFTFDLFNIPINLLHDFLVVSLIVNVLHIHPFPIDQAQMFQFVRI